MPQPQQLKLARYHFTSHSVSEADIKFLCAFLPEFCAQWCFQLELGEKTHQLHLQGRILTKERTRATALAKLFHARAPNIHMHFSPESSTGAKGISAQQWIYVTKTETRVDGPWSSSSAAVVPESWTLPTLRPWQTAAQDLLLNQNDRQILFVLDAAGNTGKSVFVKHLLSSGAILCVSCLNATQISGWLLHELAQRPQDQRQTIVLDIPRAACITARGQVDIQKWAQLMAGIEQAKDGILVDWRYRNQSLYLRQNPRVAVFSNASLPPSLLTSDRLTILDPQAYPDVSPSASTPTTSTTPTSSSTSTSTTTTTSSMSSPPAETSRFSWLPLREHPPFRRLLSTTPPPQQQPSTSTTTSAALWALPIRRHLQLIRRMSTGTPPSSTSPTSRSSQRATLVTASMSTPSSTAHTPAQRHERSASEPVRTLSPEPTTRWNFRRSSTSS
jgi:hypothetical protein